jgi:CRP-like cAMP-binding protein
MRFLPTIQIDPQDLLNIQQYFDTLLFPKAAYLYYEQQIPPGGVILLEGELVIYRNRKEVTRLAPGSFIGHQEIISGKLSNVAVQIQPGSKIIMIDKSAIQNDRGEISKVLSLK